MGFVHLHCRSGFSLLEGTATPHALVRRAKQLKMPALALTDHNSLYGMVDFYTHAQKAGIKPIIGMDVDLDDGHSLTLLARNMDGYRNLCHLATVLRLHSDPEVFAPAGFGDGEVGEYEDEDNEILPWDDGMWGVPVFAFTQKPVPIVPTGSTRRTGNAGKEPRLPREMLLSGRHSRGLIALSGGKRGGVNSLVMQGKTRQAARVAGMLLSAFGEGNFFIELTAHDEADSSAMPALVGLANDLGIPIVATNDVLYLGREDAPTALALALAAARKGVRGVRGLHGVHEVHEVHEVQGSPMQVGDGTQRAADASKAEASTEWNVEGRSEIGREVGRERYFKSAEEMAKLFGAYPQALANASYIAERCNVELPLHKPLFPSVDLHPGETPFSRLWKLCFAGATRRYRPLTKPAIARLKYEPEVIESLGFCPYFLVVYDIVRFAHSRDIPILARGSAADCMVAYVLGITQIDPIEYDLLFERFLNPSRAEFELPDIDLDLCWRRRDEVLHYVYERYGREHVAIVGTYITFKLRSAWREMAKALGVPMERINRVAARLPHILQAEGESEREDQEENEEEFDRVEDRVEGSENVLEPDEQGRRSPSDTGATGDFSLRDKTERAAFELAKAIEGLPRHMGMHCAGVVITPQATPIADLVPLQRAARDPSMAITQYDKEAIEAMGLVKMDLLGSRALTTLVDAIHASGLIMAKSAKGVAASGKGGGDLGQLLEGSAHFLVKELGNSSPLSGTLPH